MTSAFLLIEDKQRGCKISVKPSVTFHLPWDATQLVSFEAYAPELKDADDEFLSLQGFHLAAHKGHIVGLRRQLRSPAALYANPDELLRTLFKDVASEYRHSGREVRHPLVETVPHPNVGAGFLLVRNAGSLAFGDAKGNFTERNEQRRVYVMQQLQELGYEKIEHAQER